jgi:flagellar motor switch protein FliN/FliY
MMPTAPADLAAQTAAAAAAVVPSSVPLEAVPAAADDRPEPGASAVVASFVGSPSAELVLVAEAVIAEALAAAPAGAVGAVEALRPALEAAAASLGAGVLDTAHARPVADALDRAEVYALQHEGRTLGWFGVRLRSGGAAPTTSSVPTQRAGLRALYDVEMTLTAEIGRTRLPMRHVLDLAPGAVLELDRQAGSPADVMVNGRLVARGEVVVVDEDYAVRITEIVSGSDA